jgi:hypothetical protein
MLDRWAVPDGSVKPHPVRPMLRPGDPNWRQRWLAAVRRRMAASPRRLEMMREARLAALASDPALWAEVRASEAAYARGEGESFVPDTGPRGGAR